MAKPGSERARVLTGGAPLIGAVAAEAKAQLEGRAGFRCGGCGERIFQGFEFVRFVTLFDHGSGRNVAQVQRTSACAGRAGCDFALRAAEEYEAMRPVRWAWLDEAGIRQQVQAMLQRTEGETDDTDPAS